MTTPVESKADHNSEVQARLFKTAKAWETWLAKNGAKSHGVWLQIAKKGSSLKSVTIAEALDAALCYGWIDGQRKVNDADTYLQRYTPRTSRSTWSQINRDKVTALIGSGRMRAAGLAEIERAKGDGRWDAAYEPASRATVPEDLAAALEANPQAGEFFSTLKGTNRYAVLFRIQGAKRAETRARRIAHFVAMLEKRETVYPVTKKSNTT